MAEIIYAINCSLDGYIEDADGSFAWSMPSDDLHRFYNEMMRPVSTSIYGRKLYETMVVWEDMPLEDEPAVMADFAEQWRAQAKVVVSTTLEEVSSGRTTIERTLDPEWVRELAASSSGEIAIGGAQLAAAAFEHGLIDRIELTRLPVIVGGGKPVLPSGLKLDLELVRQTTFPTGEIHASYRVAGNS